MLKIQLFCKRISVVGEIMSRINAKLGLGGKSPAEIAPEKGPMALPHPCSVIPKITCIKNSLHDAYL